MGLFSSKPRPKPLPLEVRQKYKVDMKKDAWGGGTLSIHNEAGERIYCHTVFRYDDFRSIADKAIGQHEKDGTVVWFGDVSYAVLPWEQEEEDV